MSAIPQKCPSCGASLVVTGLTCSACGTGVTGSFELSPFSRLSAANLKFLEMFVRNRGNVKELERETGESYWAIRRQLDEAILEMGFDVQPDEDQSRQRVELLERLSRGELDVQETTRLLTQMGKQP